MNRTLFLFTAGGSRAIATVLDLSEGIVCRNIAIGFHNDRSSRKRERFAGRYEIVL